MHERLLQCPCSAVRSDGAWLFDLDPPAQQEAPGAVLTSSLQAAGQATPLLAVQQEGELHLVDGRRRLAALEALGREACLVLVEAPDPWRRGLVRLAANEAWRPAREAPAALVPALRFFLAQDGPDRVQAELPPLLGLQPRAKAWRRLLRWCETVPEESPWEVHLREGRIGLGAVDALERLDGAARDLLEPCFRELHWSASGAQQFLTLLYEAAMGRQCDMEAIVAEAGLHATLQAALSPKDTMARLLEGARAVRHPVRTRLEARFAAMGRELTAGTPWRVLPEQQFESDALHLHLKVRSCEELDAAAQQLRDMAGSPLWERLAAIGREEA